MTLLFYYTLLIMFFYTIVAATSLSAFYVSHRRTFLYATLGFTFYFFDVSLVFKDNFRLFGGFCGRDSGIGPAQRATTTIWN